MKLFELLRRRFRKPVKPTPRAVALAKAIEAVYDSPQLLIEKSAQLDEMLDPQWYRENWIFPGHEPSIAARSNRIPFRMRP